MDVIAWVFQRVPPECSASGRSWRMWILKDHAEMKWSLIGCYCECVTGSASLICECVILVHSGNSEPLID